MVGSFTANGEIVCDSGEHGVESLQNLLMNGAKLEEDCSIQLSVMAGNFGYSDFLLQQEVTIDPYDITEITRMPLTIYNNSEISIRKFKAVEYLFNRGAKIANSVVPVPLDDANNHDMIDLLVKNGANVSYFPTSPEDPWGHTSDTILKYRSEMPGDPFGYQYQSMYNSELAGNIHQINEL